MGIKHNIVILIKGFITIFRYINNEFRYFYRKYKSINDVVFFVLNIEKKFDEYSLRFMKNVDSKITNMDHVYILKKYYNLDLNILIKKYSDFETVKKIVSVNNFLYSRYLKQSQMICILFVVSYNNFYYIFSYVPPSTYQKYIDINPVHSFLKLLCEKDCKVNFDKEQIWFSKSHIRNIMINGKNTPTSITPFIVYL